MRYGSASAAGHQVVDHHADVGVGPATVTPSSPPRAGPGVQPGDQSLSGGFLITGGPVDLPGEEKATERASSPVSPGARAGRHNRTRWRSRQDDPRPLQPGIDATSSACTSAGSTSRCRSDRRCRRRAPRARGRSGAVALREAHDLVFDRRAIARPAAGDLPGIHRRPADVRRDDLVGGGRRPRDVARHLRRGDGAGQGREGLRRIVTGLPGQTGRSRWSCRRAAAACPS